MKKNIYSENGIPMWLVSRFYRKWKIKHRQHLMTVH